jgi:dihydrofolate reductase
LIVSLIAAIDEKGGIGKNNQIPWHLPSDLRRFKKITMGHYLIVGRKTYETIGGLLPGRIMIIVTHQRDYYAAGCLIVNSLDAAIRIAAEKQETEVFIIGGGEIFTQAISVADKIYLTSVHTNLKVDVFFPKVDDFHWETIETEEIKQDENDDYPMDFKVLIRVHQKPGLKYRN